jgi:hypothetical protein
MPQRITGRAVLQRAPFVDKEPADVVRRLVKEHKIPEAESSEPVYPALSPPDLTHSRILHARINGYVFPKPNWNLVMEYAVELAAAKLKNVDDLSKIVLAKHVKGKKIDQGYHYFDKLGLSIQGQDARSAWRTTAHIVKELGLKAELIFEWSSTAKAENAGKTGKLVIG